jgi:hypothetical protein
MVFHTKVTLRSPLLAITFDVAFGTSLLQRECAASAARSSTVHARYQPSTAIKHQTPTCRAFGWCTAACCQP